MSVLPGIRITGCPYYRVSVLPGVRITGCPYYRVSVLPGVRIKRAPRKKFGQVFQIGVRPKRDISTATKKYFNITASVTDKFKLKSLRSLKIIVSDRLFFYYFIVLETRQPNYSKKSVTFLCTEIPAVHITSFHSLKLLAGNLATKVNNH